MSARAFIVLMGIVSLGYDAVLGLLANVQRKKPLPPEVADVFDARRYAEYLEYMSEVRRADLWHKLALLGVNAALFFLVPFEGLAAAAAHDPYLTVLLTGLVFWVARMAVRLAHRYRLTFGIEERFGINRLSRARFMLDFFASGALSFVLNAAFLEVFAFLGIHMAAWTHGYSVDLGGGVAICALVLLAIAGVATLSQLVNYRIFRQKYEFTPLPEGELREKIVSLLEGTHRKIRNIYVYDESSKSTKKNAFVLRILLTRDLGIADNFLAGNSESELISVILHEIGHLKHRVGRRDVAGYAVGLALMVTVLLLVLDPRPVLDISEWCRTSFGLSSLNYVLLVELFGAILEPLSALLDVFNNWRSRGDEYEADLEAVRHGYGEDLIRTFKQLSADELVNVYPHPVVEVLTYDHPGMYHRIRAIRAAERELASEAGDEAGPGELAEVALPVSCLRERD